MNNIPAVTTKHLEAITDDFGIWQFFDGKQVLREHGYALDDAARGFIVFLLYNKKAKAEVCLQYLEKSVKDNGDIVHFFDENRKEHPLGSDKHDAVGLLFWACTFAIYSKFEVERAKNVISRLKLDGYENLPHIRPKAYLALGYSFLKDKVNATKHVQELVKAFDATENWNWFEDHMSYANAVIPYAIMRYLDVFDIQDDALSDIVRKSIQTLEFNKRIGVFPAPIGNRTWHKKGSVARDIYGQQPIDAAFMVLLLTRAYAYFGDEDYKRRAAEWMDWFYGNNIMQQSLVNDDGACVDGIDTGRVSKHAGAESTIMFLWAKKIFDQAMRASK